MLCHWLTTTPPVPADAPPLTHFVRPDALSVQQQKLLRLQPHVARAALRLVNLHHRRSLWLPALSVGHATAIASGRHAPQARAAAQTYLGELFRYCLQLGRTNLPYFAGQHGVPRHLNSRDHLVVGYPAVGLRVVQHGHPVASARTILVAGQVLAVLVHLHIPRHEKDGARVVDADTLVILLVEPLCATPIRR